MADQFDVDAMIRRFRERAEAVKNRGMPPIEGPERARFVERARLDYMDYAMLGDAEGSLDGGVLTLRIDLRPKPVQ
jgi:limonene-1,2-epoxide hydrolase